MSKLLAAALLVVLLMAGVSRAATVQQGQSSIPVTLPDGGKASLYLIIHSPNGETVTASSPWVTVEGNDSYRLPSGGTVFLQINISVPEGQALGDYPVAIQANGAALATIVITVTLPTGEIQTLQALAEVGSKLSSLQSGLQSSVEAKLAANLQTIQSRITTLEGNLSTSINEMKRYQKQVADLEAEKEALRGSLDGLRSEKAALENQTQLLQEERDQLQTTGNALRGESPVLFVMGLLLGAGGIFLFYRKLHKYL